MKKFILFAAILFAGVSVVKAQTSPSSLLTVKLSPFQSISVTGEALIEFDDASDYLTKTEVEQTSSSVKVNVSSAGAFFVRVYAADLVQTGNVTNKLLSSLIKVSATPNAEATTTQVNTTAAYTATLAGTDTATGEVLISSDIGELGMVYDIAFKAVDAGTAYRNSFNAGTGNDVTQEYTTTVFYEVATK